MKDELKNKMYNYQVNPPEKIWSAIVREFDDEINATFPKKLYSYEIAAPDGIWGKIAHELDEPLIKSIPVYKKINPIWRYAAAAALIGIVAFSFFWFNNENVAVSERLADIPEASTPQKTNNLPTPQYQEPAMNESNAALAGNKEIDNKKWVAKNSYREEYPTQRIYAYASIDELRNSPAKLSHSFSVDDMIVNLQPRDYTAQQIAYNPSQVAESNPYVTVITPDGYVVRISQKLAGMIGCLNNEPTLNDVDCKALVQKWREQIAQSPISPSPGNFLDMMDLINSIKENTP